MCNGSGATDVLLVVNRHHSYGLAWNDQFEHSARLIRTYEGIPTVRSHDGAGYRQATPHPLAGTLSGTIDTLESVD